MKAFAAALKLLAVAAVLGILWYAYTSGWAVGSLYRHTHDRRFLRTVVLQFRRGRLVNFDPRSYAL